MTGYSQRSEGAKIPAIMKGNQTERNNNKQYGLLMNMPTKEKGSIATERDRTDKDLPGWFVEEADKNWLNFISFGMPYCNTG